MRNRKDSATLEAEGWEKRFIACSPRLEEAVEVYEAAGYEVYLAEVDPDDPEIKCLFCFEKPDELKKYRIIYTRKRGNPLKSLEGEVYDGEGLF